MLEKYKGINKLVKVEEYNSYIRGIVRYTIILGNGRGDLKTLDEFSDEELDDMMIKMRRSKYLLPDILKTMGHYRLGYVMLEVYHRLYGEDIEQICGN